jgi:hypothetical protein
MPSHQRTITRRRLLAATAATTPWLGFPSLRAARGAEPAASAETLAQTLHASLTPAQREAVCFAWDYRHPKFGLLRTRVANNWNATKPAVKSDFFTADQQQLVRGIFEQLISPDWLTRFDKQLEDDTGGFGHDQSIALLGEPGSGQFQFLLTGRHMTLRCDGDSAEHVAFGGPIFYGHDAGGFNEEKNHAGNVFWPQAVAANGVYAILDGRQREQALVPKAPRETAIAFRGANGGEGLAAQGGLEGCRLAFYRDEDLGNDGVWDNWRLEGPAFVWHFRGAPHVHVWVNIADTPAVPTNA